VLRWAHALVWLLLALAAFLGHARLIDLARLAALVSLLVYLAFLATYLTSRQP
jgi:hypothetical protein